VRKKQQDAAVNGARKKTPQMGLCGQSSSVEFGANMFQKLCIF
jgi:hypothetical protein